jgi:hypothetical protein
LEKKGNINCLCYRNSKNQRDEFSFWISKRIVKQTLRLNSSEERISWVLKSTTTIMIYFFLGLTVLAALLRRIKYLCLDCYDTFFPLKYFLQRIYITAKHLQSPNLDRVTGLAIRLAIVRAKSIPREHILLVIVSAVIELDALKLSILVCVLACFLRDPPGHELDAQVLNHRRAALRLMVYVVLLELMLLKTLAELLIEAVSLAGGVTSILWAYVSNVIMTGAIGDGEAVINGIIAKLY